MPLRTQFEPPIVIETLVAGRHRSIGSVRGATEALLEEWPEGKRRGDAYREATRTCVKALQGKSTPFQARRAFVAAAMAADVLIREAMTSEKC